MTSAHRTPAARLTLLTLCIAMLMPSLDTSIANAGLPMLERAFDAPFQAIQWIVLAYLLAITTVIVSAGRLGDLLGRRRLLLIGIASFTATSLICGLAPTLPFLIAARALQGVGGAIMLALTIAFVGDSVPQERTGAAMGLLGTMSAVGTTLGPSLGGLLIAGLGWRAIFFINVPLGIVSLAMAYFILPNRRRAAQQAGARFDIAGTALLALTLCAYALAMTMGNGRFEVLNLALVIVAVAGGIAFSRIEATAISPIVRPEVFRDRALRARVAMSALVTTVMMATLVAGPFYLSRTLGLTTALGGITLSAGPLVAAVTGVPAGQIVDRIGAPRATIAGLFGMMMGSCALAILPASSGIIGYVAPIAVLTSGYALFQAANNTALMTGVAPDRRGVISGILSLARNLGLISGASVMGAIFALVGLRATFAVATLLVAVAIGLALRREHASTAVVLTD